MKNLKKQKEFFENTHHLMVVDNHSTHNKEPNYWDILLSDIKNEPKKWDGKIALDFGCGCGRNIKNLYDLADFKRVDGVDISNKNAMYSKEYINKTNPNNGTITWENDGETLKPCEDNVYDFIMSHQVIQHIGSYDTRFCLLTDMYRVLKPNGLLSIHYMDLQSPLKYYDNSDEVLNMGPVNVEYVLEDLRNIGFVDITYHKKNDYYGSRPEYYFKCTKR